MTKLFTLAAAAAASGYSEQHLRKLCREKKVAHTLRGGTRYMFTAEELEGLARHVAVAVQIEKIEKRELKKAVAEVDALGLPKKGAHDHSEEETGE